MEPYVVTELRNDLLNYGRCVWSIEDNEFEFSIRRYSPTERFYSLEID